MASATSAKKGSFFLWIFFLISVILVGYYAAPWALKRAAASGNSFDRAVLVFPDSLVYDPNPSACHDTWGCVNFAMHPDLRGEQAVYPSKRLKHPTIIYRTAENPISYLVSIDGSNEGSEQNPRAVHTMMHAGIPPIPHGAKVRVRFAGGALSDFHGNQNSRWDAGSLQPLFRNGMYLNQQMRDGHPYEALQVRLATASGRHTPWQKFCVVKNMGLSPFNPQKVCGDYELEIANELGEDAWLEFLYNAVWIWDSHLTGADTLARDYFAKGAGLNGDRLSMLVRYVFGQ